MVLEILYLLRALITRSNFSMNTRQKKRETFFFDGHYKPIFLYFFLFAEGLIIEADAHFSCNSIVNGDLNNKYLFM